MMAMALCHPVGAFARPDVLSGLRPKGLLLDVVEMLHRCAPRHDRPLDDGLWSATTLRNYYLTNNNS
jgi:hypothetical protein